MLDTKEAEEDPLLRRGLQVRVSQPRRGQTVFKPNFRQMFSMLFYYESGILDMMNDLKRP